MESAAFDALVMRWYGFRSSMLSFLENRDVILSPVNALPAQPHGAVRDDLRAFSYTMAYNLTGWPVTVVRAGTSSSDLPIGVQIAARPWREDVSLAAAAWVERELGAFPPPDLSRER